PQRDDRARKDSGQQEERPKPLGRKRPSGPPRLFGYFALEEQRSLHWSPGRDQRGPLRRFRHERFAIPRRIDRPLDDLARPAASCGGGGDVMAKAQERLAHLGGL